ncbi:MAG: FAD-dependent oxidoreductase [Clostridia bacterium]|nr:FAD-dependent oxidoreductase [Clostridia bacterium]
MKIFDCIVIGAGVVGSSIFNKLTRIGKSCLLLDKASDVATGASKANSGIVHAGYDPKPNSLKAKMNVRGNQLYPQICERLGVKLNHCGALVVGNDMEKVTALHERAKINGVETEIWDRAQIKEKVPCISDDVTCALYAVNSYVVSPYLFTISLADEGVLNGGEIALEEDIVSVKKGEYFEIKTQKTTYFSRFIVNSAGAGYNDVAKILGAEEKELIFRRGEYFVFDKAYNIDVPCTVFPLPTKVSKGILVTPTVDGNFLVGPTSDESDTSKKVTLDGLESIKWQL